MIAIIWESLLFAQSERVLSGRILDEDLDPVAGAYVISVKEGQVLGETDLEGCFSVHVDSSLIDFSFVLLGMETATITVNSSNEYIELILMYDVIYDFATEKTIFRKRRRRYNSIPKLHKKAYLQGKFKDYIRRSVF